jgi:diguanylate cyclase (GGDEF)-like protein
MRVSPEIRLIAAFVAGAGALLFAAMLVLSSGAAFIEAERRVDALLASDVLSHLSTTIEAAEDDAERRAVTRRVATLASDVRAARTAARGDLDATVRAAAVLGALTIALFCLAYAASLRALRGQRRLAEQLDEESNHDALTGLPNRRFFAEWLAYAIAHARRERGHVGVLFIDINGCSAVREFHGESGADALLIEIARRFRSASREGDLFARLGPTEFALATPNARDSRQLALLAQRLRDQLNETAQPPLADTPIGASIGIAFFPEDANDSAGIMAAANAAMYAARRAGRNHVAFNALAA